MLSLDNAYLFLVSAVRYALGLYYPDPDLEEKKKRKNRARRTYIVKWTCDQARAIAPELTPAQRSVLIRDIRDCEDYGDNCDKREWFLLLEWLKSLPTA